MKQLGVSIAGIDYAVGPIVISAVSIPNLFTKKIHVRIPGNPTLAQEALIYQKTVKFVDYAPFKELKAGNLQEIESAIASLIVSMPKFWEYEISMDAAPNGSKYKWENYLPPAAKEQLQRTPLIIAPALSMANKLSKIYADYKHKMNLRDIKTIWGEFGEGLLSDPITRAFIEEHPECIHVRGSKWLGGV